MECSDTGIIDSPPSSESFDSTGNHDTDRSSSSLCHDSTLDEASLPQFSPMAGGIGGSLTRRSTPPLLSNGDPAHSSSAPHPDKTPSTSPLGPNTPQPRMLFFRSLSQQRDEGSPVHTPPSFPSPSPTCTDSSGKSTQSMPVATSALYGTDSPITHVAFEHPFQPRLNSLEPINASAGFVNANSTYSFLDSLSPFTYSAQAMDTYSNPFPTPPTIRIDPRHTPLEEIPTRQAQFPPIPSDLQAHFAKLPRPPLVSHTIIDYESQDGLLPTPAHKLDLTAPLRLLSSNSIDRGPIPPPAMSPHPFLPPQPKSFVRPLPKPRTPPHRSKANKKCSHQPSKLLEVILERPNLPSPSLPNPKAVVPPKQKIHTFRTFIPQSQRQNGSEQATVIPEHPNSHFPSPPKAKAKGPPMPTIRSFRTFVPQSQRQNGSEQATVIPEHPNSHFPSPPKAKAKGPPMPTIRSFRTFVPQSQRQNGSEEVFTIVQSDPVKPHPVGKAKSLPHQPPRPKAKRRHQPPKAASVPPNQDAGRREIHFEASSFHPFQRCYSYEEQSLADGLQCLFGGPYYLNNIFFYEPVRYLKKRVRLFHLWKNMNLFEYYVPYFRPEARQRWYIGTVGDVIDRRLRIAWIKHEQFPDNVFLDMSILTPIEERNIRPKALVVFLIRVNKYPSSYFEAREAFLWPGKVQDISIRLI